MEIIINSEYVRFKSSIAKVKKEMGTKASITHQEEIYRNIMYPVLMDILDRTVESMVDNHSDLHRLRSREMTSWILSSENDALGKK